MAKLISQVAPTKLTDTAVGNLPSAMRAAINDAKKVDHRVAVKALLEDLSNADGLPRELKRVETSGNMLGSNLTLFFKTNSSPASSFDNITLPVMNGVQSGLFKTIVTSLSNAVNYLTSSGEDPIRVVLAKVDFYMASAADGRYTDEGIVVARILSVASDQEFEKWPSGVKGAYELMKQSMATTVKDELAAALTQDILVLSTNKKYDNGAAAVVQLLEGLEFKNVAQSVVNPEDASPERHFDELKQKIHTLELLVSQLKGEPSS